MDPWDNHKTEKLAGLADIRTFGRRRSYVNLEKRK
jgi:hypothetical protein